MNNPEADPSEPFTRRSLRHLTRRRLRRVRELIGDDPRFLPVVLRATPLGTSRRLGPTTQLVIEGFPRSGNTFAVNAFRHANPEVNASSHVHTPSQVKLAVSLRIPSLVVIREPLPTVTSLLIAAPWVQIPAALNEYVHHHQQIIPHAHGFMVATFQQVTCDFGSVTRALNDRFGTSFLPFDHNPQTVEQVFSLIDEHHDRVHGGTENVVPRPSISRRDARQWLEDELAAPRHASLLAEAHSVYEALTTRSCDAVLDRGRPMGPPSG